MQEKGIVCTFVLILENQHHRHHTELPKTLGHVAHSRSSKPSRLIKPSRNVSRTKQTHEGQVTKKSKAKRKVKTDEPPLRLYTWEKKRRVSPRRRKRSEKQSRKKEHGEGAPVQREKWQWERSWDACSSAILQVVARDETWSAAVAADDLGLPPAVVLQSQDSEDVAFAE